MRLTRKRLRLQQMTPSINKRDIITLNLDTDESENL